MAWSDEMRAFREKILGWRTAVVVLVGALLIFAGLSLFATRANAQTRQCAQHSYREVCSSQWPYDRCWRQRYCARHAYRDHHHHYRTPAHVRDDENDSSWNRRDPRFERGVQCKFERRDVPAMVRVVGPARLNEKAALEAAIRQWQSSVAYDSGEKFMDLSDARFYRWRCNRASSNESVVGKAGEAVFGDAAVQKKCAVVAQPCLPAMKEGDKDEK